MTPLKIYGELTLSSEDNFYASLPYKENGFILASALYKLYEEDIQYNIISGFVQDAWRRCKFDECTIEIDNIDSEKLYDILPDDMIAIVANTGNEFTLQLLQ